MSQRLDLLKKKVRAAVLPGKTQILQRFFKTAPGEYGAGDKFLGLMVPAARKIAKEFKDLSLKDINRLIKDPYHELRLIALLILVENYQIAKDQLRRKQILDFYLQNTRYINNWDLVDLSVYKILGDYLLLYPREKKLLVKLANSRSLWEKRMAMVATFAFIKAGSSQETLKIAKILVYDQHDLIQKAVGWMLREMGKRLGERELKAFLDHYYRTMPRTALRYAIERLKPAEREHYLYAA